MRDGAQNLDALGTYTLAETVYKRSHAKTAIDLLVDEKIVEQTSTGRSAAEKVYKLTNGGAPQEQQSSQIYRSMTLDGRASIGWKLSDRSFGGKPPNTMGRSRNEGHLVRETPGFGSRSASAGGLSTFPVSGGMSYGVRG